MVFTTSAYITFVENGRFNITDNSVNETVFDSIIPNEIIPPCYFQFFSSHARDFTTSLQSFGVLINNTISKHVFSESTKNINCKMSPGSVFSEHNPLEVYQHIIHFQNENINVLSLFDTGLLCYCTNGEKKIVKLIIHWVLYIKKL